MIHSQAWAWVTLFLLGAYHGINPAMGWLFAVSLGLQKQSGRAVWQALLPIAAGHVFAIVLVILVAVLAGAVLPLHIMKIVVAIVLFGFGVYRLVGKSHPHWGGGMQVGFSDLTVWSFLMASAHGAGFMLLPVLLGMSAMNSGHEMHAMKLPGIGAQLLAISVHTLGYLVLTGAIAGAVYKWLGLSLLRKAWFNLDLIWAIALIATAALTLLLT
ncbi:MAG: hypothetical protein WAK48_30400 [Candidatus Acidiferrum sp.]|jgi:hypothetical protein